MLGDVSDSKLILLLTKRDEPKTSHLPKEIRDRPELKTVLMHQSSLAMSLLCSNTPIRKMYGSHFSAHQIYKK